MVHLKIILCGILACVIVSVTKHVNLKHIKNLDPNEIKIDKKS